MVVGSDSFVKKSWLVFDIRSRMRVRKRGRPNNGKRLTYRRCGWAAWVRLILLLTLLEVLVSEAPCRQIHNVSSKNGAMKWLAHIRL